MIEYIDVPLDWTVEIYRLDRRHADGKKLVEKIEYPNTLWEDLEKKYPHRPYYVRRIERTHVTRKNLITGEEYKERYDTSFSCSPSSETYWSA